MKQGEDRRGKDASASRKQFLGCAAIGLGAALYPSLKWFTSGNPESETTPLEDGYRELSGFISEVMTQFGIPGLSFALITASGKVWSRGFGVRDAATNEPVTTETVFQAGSLTKPVFARAVLTLVERKILDLGQPIAPYLPDELIHKEPRLKLVTARMFLSHTSGIAGPLDAPAFNFAPGERFEYASRGFQLMQMAVERLTGLSLARFVDRNVLEPCGMHNSSIGWTMTQWWRAAQGHFKNGKSRATRIKLEPSAVAGLLTTAGDYARFMQETLRSKREMLNPQVKFGDGLAWGLGWGLEADAFWHWGDQDIFTSFALMDTRSGTGVVILTNSANGHQA